MKTSYVFVILGVLLGFDQAYAINHIKDFRDGRWDIDVQGSYLRSNQNYSSSGSVQDLTGSNYYQLIDVVSGARWGITDEMNLYAYGNFSTAESKDATATRTNSGFTKAILGGDILVNMEGFSIIPEVQVVVALTKVDQNSDTAINTEGVNELTAKLNMQSEMESLNLFGYVGFTYRDSGRSSLLPWSVSAEYSFQKLRGGVELFGFQSITSDRDKGDVGQGVRQTYVSIVNAGSSHFYVVDPSVIDLNLYGKFDVGKKMAMWVGAGHTLAGSNYSSGFHFEGGLRYTLGGAEKQSRSKSTVKTEPQTRTTKKVNQFQEDTNDGVDQTMFKPTPTPVPKVQPKKKPETTAQPIQDKMDDVEMEIELKANKKKGG